LVSFSSFFLILTLHEQINIRILNNIPWRNGSVPDVDIITTRIPEILSVAFSRILLLRNSLNPGYAQDVKQIRVFSKKWPDFFLSTPYFNKDERILMDFHLIHCFGHKSPD